MRRAFGKWITKKAEEDDKIYLLVGDIGFGIFDDFRAKFPNRFINIGICEQSMVSISAGLALGGLKPYVYTITPFLIERPFEQIKVDIDLNNANVKLIGYDDYPKQGPTHKCVDHPIKIMRLFDNIRGYYPMDSKGTIQALEKSYASGRPTFIHLKRDKNER